jgi:hypothetical protein
MAKNRNYYGLGVNLGLNDDKFKKIYPINQENCLVPFIIGSPFTKDKLSFLWSVDSLSTTPRNTIHDTLRCRECSKTIDKYARCVDVNNKSMFSGCPDEYSDLDRDASLDKRGEFILLPDVARLGKPSSGGFDHYTMNIQTPSKFVGYTKEDYDWYFNQNLGTMLRVLENCSEDGMVESLELLIGSLSDITYGDKLIDSARWFLKHLTEYRNAYTDMRKQLVGVTALLDTPLVKGEYPERINNPYWQQFKNNTLGAMEKAGNVGELKSFLRVRLAPHNYCRPTTRPTESQEAEAKEFFDSFGFLKDDKAHTSLMRLSEIKEYGGDVVGQIDIGRFAAGFETPSGAAGLAARSNRTMSTIKKLVEFLPTNLEIFIDRTTTPVCYLTTFPESADGLFKHKHLWGYPKNTCPTECGLDLKKWHPVNALTMMRDRNVFVGVSGAKPKSKMGNTCFPEFLNSAYQRKYRKAFEDFNKHSMFIPTDTQEFAIGVGSSRKDEKGQLSHPLRFRYPTGPDTWNTFTISMY